MAQLFADRCREARRGSSSLAAGLRIAGLWLQALRDALVHGVGARLGIGERRAAAGFGSTGSRRGGPGAPPPSGRLRETAVGQTLYDLRHAVRDFLSAPAFTAVAVGSLALGIGASTAIFTLLNAVALRPLAVPDPHRLVRIHTVDTGFETFSMTNPQWEALRDREDFLDGVFASSIRYFNVGAEDDPERVRGEWVSGGFFSTLALGAAQGRLLEAADDVRGCPAIAVIGHGFWRRRFAGDPAAIGSTLRLDGHAFEIVGVAPATFTGFTVDMVTDVWAPLCAEALVQGERSILDARRTWFMRVIGRRPADMDAEELDARIAALAPAVLAESVPLTYGPAEQAEYLGGSLVTTGAANGFSTLRGEYEQPLEILLLAVGVVMLVVCANLANLLLARTARRRSEIAMRVALGAGRGRLARQFFTESLLLSMVGTLVGVGVAYAACRALVPLIAPADAAFALDLSPDLRVLAFTSLVAVAAGVLFGLAPALHAARIDPHAALQGAGLVRGRTASLRGGGALVAAQMTLSLVLLSGAALLVGTFWRLETLDPGFARDRVVLVEADIGRGGFEAEQRRQTYVDLVQRVRGIAGVEAASYAELTPISGNSVSEYLVATGYESLLDEDAEVWVHRVGEGYFAAMGMPVLAGRGFDDGDIENVEPVAVLSVSAARSVFGDADVVGRRLHRRLSDSEVGEPIRVVGVVPDARYRSLRDDENATVYFALRQQPARFFASSLTVHVLPEPGAAPLPAVRDAIEAAAPGARAQASPLSAQLSASLARERLLAILAGFFGALALLLAVIGLYGVMSFNVARRFPEIGVRLALGSSPPAVFSLVLRQAARPVLAGLVLGAVGSFAVARTVETMVYGFDPYDPRLLAAAAAVLTVAALASAGLPARRAARLDPAVVLRRDEG